MEPIYRSDGEWVAVYEKGHLFNVHGTWLGFSVGKDVFDPGGKYLGFISEDNRLLRARTSKDHPPRREPAPRPERPRVPAYMPLAPLMRELPFHLVDVFEEEGERLLFISETRPDME